MLKLCYMNGHRTAGCLLAITLLLAGCAGDPEPGIEYLKEFDVPYTDGFPLLHSYIIEPEGDSVHHLYSFEKRSGDSVLLDVKYYYNGIPTRENRYLLSGGRKILLQTYFFDTIGDTADENAKLAGKIVDCKEKESSGRIRDTYLEVVFVNSIGFKTYVEDRTSFLEDTTVAWRGGHLKALRFSYRQSIKKTIGILPFIKRTLSDAKGSFLYASGIGLYGLNACEDGLCSTMRLVSIKTLSGPAGSEEDFFDKTVASRNQNE